jgi:hypothetical protein
MAEADQHGTRPQILQFMTTEHFVLQTARSATIQEANGRASLFLTSVSSATIALAFVAQVTQMGAPFLLFSLILLPCLYFIGLATFVRAVQLAIEDMVHARGMARIRHYYAELAPSMERYLVHSTHDDYLTLLPDLGLKPSPWQFFMTTSGMVSAIDSVIAGVFAALMARTVAGSMIAAAVVVGISVFAASVLLLRRYHIRAWRAAERQLTTLFPRAR